MEDAIPTSLVVDASIAFKWFVPEQRGDIALALLDQDIRFVAPDLIFAEVGNAMWVRLRKIQGGRDATVAAQSALRRILHRTIPAHELVARATEIAFDLGHPVYDCIYLAMCEREKARLLTADDGLRRSVEGTDYADLVGDRL